MTSPFIAGQQARKAGEPLTANPHPDAPFLPDQYPGDRALWADGWKTQDYRIKHDEARP